ncbi:MAG: PqqD family protein [Candidatus Riflebacteria bacterium]|nr:PqqD family protein [Candidatus Riflebacteria bacterium]
MELSLKSRVKQAPDIMSAKMDNELVMVNMSRSNYVGMDEIGRIIWELSVEPVTVWDICKHLSEEFDASPEKIADDVLPFIGSLLKEGLLIRDDN